MPSKHVPRNVSRPHISLGVLLVLAAGLGMIHAKENLPKDDRLVLIRELDHEIAVTKLPLPKGRHGVYVSASGKLDQVKAREELRTQGTAVSPGMPIEITKMTFKGDRILFEINGGGKTGKKWYQHIEVGMGTSTSPVALLSRTPRLSTVRTSRSKSRGTSKT